MMRVFKTLIMIVVSVCFVMGVSYVAWSGPQQPGVEKSTIKKPKPMYIIKLGCVHEGTPVDFPDDIVITNITGPTLKKGTYIKWESYHGTYQGVVKLDKDLSKGKSIFVPNAFPGGIEAGRKCKAQVIKLFRIESLPHFKK